MYKNFTLTESEKEQILKQHKSHGYKKPLNEDIEDSVEPTGDSGLRIDKYVFAPINVYMVDVIINEDEDPVVVEVTTHGDELGKETYAISSYLEDGDDPEKYISVVRQAVENGLLTGMPEGILINGETKEIEG